MKTKKKKTKMIAFRGWKAKLTAHELFNEFNANGPYEIFESQCCVTPSMRDGRDQLWVAIGGFTRGWRCGVIKRFLYKSKTLIYVTEGTLYDQNSINWGLGGENIAPTEGQEND